MLTFEGNIYNDKTIFKNTRNKLPLIKMQISYVLQRSLLEAAIHPKFWPKMGQAKIKQASMYTNITTQKNAAMKLNPPSQSYQDIIIITLAIILQLIIQVQK